MTSRNWVSSCKNCGIDVNWMKCLWEYSISDSPQNLITMHSQILLQGRSKHSNIKLRYFWEVSIAVGVVFFVIGLSRMLIVTSCLLFLFSLYSSFPISIFTYLSNCTAQWSYQWWWPLCVCLCVCPCLCVYACALIVLVFNVFIIALVSDLIGGGCWIVASYLLSPPLIHPTQSLPSPSPKLLLFA